VQRFFLTGEVMSTAQTVDLQNEVVSMDQWNAIQAAHLAEEKRLTRLRDELTEKRRQLPWVRIEKEYAFDTPAGKKTLSELFDGRSQLAVKHFMLGPGWKEGCVGCSFECDHLDPTVVHLANHDVTVVVVSIAPLAEIATFQQRMGWKFPWVSSAGSEFNYDFHVSATAEDKARGKFFYNFAEGDYQVDELSGFSFFYKNDAGEIFLTFASFGRGMAELLGAYSILDRTVKGRNENGKYRNMADWIRHHDRYGADGFMDGTTGRFISLESLSGGNGE